jgi:hypothetical protein
MTKKIEVELPVISREVAEAIESWLEEYGDRDALIAWHVEGIAYKSWTAGCRVLNDVSVAEMSRYLFIGYTVEQTPEEKVREYYENAKQCADIYANGEGFRVEAEAIIKTLDLLGIKIGGVNADDEQKTHN